MEISMKIDGTSIDVEWENNDTAKELKERIKKRRVNYSVV